MSSLRQKQSALVLATMRAFLTLLLATAAAAELCPPKPDTIPVFDVAAYLGTWYQATAIPSWFQPADSKCSRAIYGDNGDGTVSVFNVMNTADGEYDEICGYALVPDPDFPGELEVHFPGSPVGDYWVLDTDYENFASVYSCQNLLGFSKLEFGWVLTRERNPDESLVTLALEVFSSRNISVASFVSTAQGDDCVYDTPNPPSCSESKQRVL